MKRGGRFILFKKNINRDKNIGTLVHTAHYVIYALQ